MVTAMEPKTFGKFTPDADAEIKAAASAYGIEPKLLRAIIAAESSGDWESNNRTVYPGCFTERGPIFPYVGMYSSVAEKHGISFFSIDGDRQRQIYALASVLSDFQATDPRGAAAMWFSASDYPDKDSISATKQYAERIVQWMEQMGDF